MNSEFKISKELQNAYSEQYTDDILEWRKAGAENKVKNIIAVSNNYKFNNIIEIGAGNGAILQTLEKNNFAKQLNAIEISDSALTYIKKRNLKSLKEAKKYDGYNIPFEDETFDLAICTHVIEHVEFERKLLREIKRISKFQIFEVPIEFSHSIDNKVEHFLSYGHINIYSVASFKFLLKSEGFKIINEKISFYDKKIDELIDKDNKTKLPYLKYLKLKIAKKIKRTIFNLLPKSLKKRKPQTYTVLTNSGEAQINKIKL